MPDNLAGPGSDVTDLLGRWGRGDREALDRLMPLVYQELHRTASRCLTTERSGHTLQSTALVHEAYVRLLETAEVLSTSPSTVNREWMLARAWLRRELEGAGSSPD